MQTHDFDIAVTFAGEDRVFVEEVVKQVKAHGLSVFYDEDAKVEMWGEDLTEYFSDVYERRARYAVMFVSAHYARKAWTRLERRSVLTRALQSDSPYLLPVRMDSTELPGVRSAIGYLEADKEGADGVAAAIRAKAGSQGIDFSHRFNGRVPRTAAEAALLLGERPAGWEYIILSYFLSTGLDLLKERYNDHRIQFAIGGDFVPNEDLMGYLQAELSRMTAIVDTFEKLLLGPAQEQAMGAPGKTGDPELIEHLAKRLLAIYGELLSWAHRLRAASTPLDGGREATQALADYADQPVEAIRDFIFNFQRRMDEVTERLTAGEDISLTLAIKFEIPDGVSQRYQTALEELANKL